MVDELVLRNGDRIFTTTLIIAKGVGIEHRSVMRLLQNHSGRKIISGFEILKLSNGGRPVEYVELTEKQSTFLISLMKNSERVVDFKEKLVEEFYRMRNVLSGIVYQRDWEKVRSDGKQVYFQKTDVIKRFVEYATEQGSKSASMYYMNFSKMENSALFFMEQKYKNVREFLNIRQLMQVATADNIIEKAIEEGMENKLFYKDIYKLTKEKIVAFSDLIGKSPVSELGFIKQNTLL